jgi:negative elongation factor C/D
MYSLPVASMAVLAWLQHILLDTPFYETYFRVTEIPAPLLLMEEVEYYIIPTGQYITV